MSDATREEPSAEALIAQIRALSSQGRRNALTVLLRETDPADLAETLPDLSPDQMQQVFSLLDVESAGEVLAEADPVSRTEVIDAFDPGRIADLLEEMDSDDAADALSEVDPTDAEEILRLMAAAESEGVRTILQYPEDSAGGIMNLDYAWVSEGMTVAQAISMLRSLTPDQEPLEIHVIDADRRLVGAVPIRRLLTRSPDTTLGTIMDTDVHPVRAEVDQEEVARLFAKYDLVATPVVDSERRLIGEITVDDVVDVIREEATEDLYLMAGTSEDEADQASAFAAARLRFPWLAVLLVGELLCGVLISAFETTITAKVALFSFVPVLMALGGAAGQQGATVIVRALAIRRVSGSLVRRYVIKEVLANLLLGVVIGALLGVVAALWIRDAWLAGAVALAAFLNVGKTGFFSSGLPLLFRRLGIDPAIATGPIIATLNDILGVGIYLLLAAVAMAVSS